jgi:hypothetical protein
MINLFNDAQSFLTDLSFPGDHFRRHFVHLESGKATVVPGQVSKL